MLVNGISEIIWNKKKDKELTSGSHCSVHLAYINYKVYSTIQMETITYETDEWKSQGEPKQGDLIYKQCKNKQN